MSRWTQHKEKWIDCQECDLCERRKNVVLCRGKLPCDMLFIGEAPGTSEDVLGKPFVGKAGKLLDEMIENSIPKSTRLAFTNLIGCIPLEDNGKKAKEPSEKSIKACSDRLQELIEIAKPEVIVLVGKLSAKWIALNHPEDIAKTFCEIMHPAAILRADISQKGLAIQRCEVTLRDAAESLIPF